MYRVNEDNSIEVTRGDIVSLTVTAEKDGTAYVFQPGDVLRFTIYAKKKAEDVVLQKDFPVITATESVDIFLSEQDTKLGNVISKPTDYWYEVELNPDNDPQTIIGYDEDGAKVFKLYPEGEIPESDEEDTEITEEDIPIVDTALDFYSPRPVENRVVARAFVKQESLIKDTRKMADANKDALCVEKTRIDNLIAGGTVDDAEILDARVDHMGRLWSTAGEAVRGMTSDLDSMFEVYTSPNLLNIDALSVDSGMSQTGKEWVLTGAALTDYIQVSEGQVVSYQRSMTDGVPFISPMRWVCAFDADKNVLSDAGTGDDGVSVTSYTVPVGVSFVRVTLGGYSNEINATNAMIHTGNAVIPYEKYGTIRNLKITPDSRRIALPYMWYAFVGHPVSAYFRNIMDYNPSCVHTRVFGDLGNQYADRWEYTPTTAGVFANAFQIYNNDYEELNNCDTRLVVKNKSLKNHISVLVIGDSTVEAGAETNKMLEIAKADGFSMELLGTRGTAVNRHEGRSGWTAKRYMSEAESASGVKNAFYNPASNAFDFSYYMQSNGYSGVDCVFLQIGINDVFGARTDEEVSAAICTYVDNMASIVNSIHEYNASTNVVINLIIPGDADQNKFGQAYGVSQTAWKYKKNTHDANIALLDRFDGMANVYLSPFNAAIDTANNMNGDVHPTANGYNQLGEQMYSYMRAIN